MTKIALVVSHLRGGGKEQCVVTLANALFGEGFEPVIVCLETSGTLEARIRHPEVRVLAMNKRAGNDLILPLRLARLLRREAIDVVHSNNWGTLVESVLATKWAGIRTIIHTQHGLEYEESDSRARPRSSLRTLAKRFSSRWISQIAAVSCEVRDMVIEEWCVPAERVTVIHNGIELIGVPITHDVRAKLRCRIGLNETDFVIGSVGFFRPVKDFPCLAEAMAQVVSRVPQARLVLVGDGPSKKDIQDTVDRLGLASFVRFLGWQADVTELLPLLDLFVLCSLSEGISLSILEAMATGLPVVATQVGGNPEIIQDGKTGILVPPRSPSETAKAILSLIENPHWRKAMGQRGREVVRMNFSAQRMAREYTRLYGEGRT